MIPRSPHDVVDVEGPLVHIQAAVLRLISLIGIVSTTLEDSHPLVQAHDVLMLGRIGRRGRGVMAGAGLEHRGADEADRRDDGGDDAAQDDRKLIPSPGRGSIASCCEDGMKRR